ncbi:hypothetical protein KC19_1G202100 [Ceratodon purpureus]|uniref:Secreted protein n=1 Tax=Ceratodon purpureus TaxID=3225 RepID=A0A8T0J7B0_CERPU|nr:hypothetical protein KC19_1G202100 [Ceratodon purpureus]
MGTEVLCLLIGLNMHSFQGCQPVNNRKSYCTLGWVRHVSFPCVFLSATHLCSWLGTGNNSSGRSELNETADIHHTYSRLVPWHFSCSMK